jgi:hypothetical protein
VRPADRAATPRDPRPAETAEGLPKPPPRLSLPPRVVDGVVVLGVLVLYIGFLSSTLYVHAVPGQTRPRISPEWNVHVVLGIVFLPAVFALWWRTRYPMHVLAIVLVAFAVAYPFPSLAALVALYTVASRRPFRTAIAATVATAVCHLLGGAFYRGAVEVGDVASAVTTAAAALAIGLYVGARRAYIARLRERALFARALASFLPPQVARLVETSPSALSLTAELEASVLFCDIRGFSSVAERLGPRDTAAVVGRYVSAMPPSSPNTAGPWTSSRETA